MQYTIKQVSEMLGFSKVYITKKMNDNYRKQYVNKIGNKFLIDENGIDALKELLNQSAEPTTEPSKEAPSSRCASDTTTNEEPTVAEVVLYRQMIEQLQDSLTEKDEIILDLKSTIEFLKAHIVEQDTALKNAQTLQLLTIKKKSIWSRLLPSRRNAEQL